MGKLIQLESVRAVKELLKINSPEALYRWYCKYGDLIRQSDHPSILPQVGARKK
ncbi:hypothetical protein SAMN04487866_12222 [Thermoactinomyces sp. DSM 45891]|uniref:hypothetical protein n=1 Tax=Thermoactinomyces sp. DSM 45891 TaxID=1761907 RepID=UPI0009166A44|nr:hypothetical protein [Thermoactinomyces sp. DSM 45891]SFX74890.1 hypothetical protein SAMN04487866_12222 [Thermoactinomyces sp. DSM 45891]